MGKENSGNFKCGNRSGSLLYDDVADKSQVVCGNRGNRPKKYRRGNQNGNSDGKNFNGRAKASGVANFEHEKP